MHMVTLYVSTINVACGPVPLKNRDQQVCYLPGTHKLVQL